MDRNCLKSRCDPYDVIQQATEEGGKRLKHVAKAYEAMPPEDAATRLAGLDNETSVQILLKMETDKGGGFLLEKLSLSRKYFIYFKS
ncbi:MAG: hypothetical protein HZB30_04475 [Nitrospirae bacterium]|nr:hypothetical protein [Nitrospirota bacterium]